MHDENDQCQTLVLGLGASWHCLRLARGTLITVYLGVSHCIMYVIKVDENSLTYLLPTQNMINKEIIAIIMKYI